MQKKGTSAHSILLNDIALLKEKRCLQEKILKRSLKDTALSLKPLSLIKESIHQLAIDKEVKQDLVTVGIKFGANFLIEKVMGKNSSVKGFIGSALIKQLASGFITKKITPFLFQNEQEKP